MASEKNRTIGMCGRIPFRASPISTPGISTVQGQPYQPLNSFRPVEIIPPAAEERSPLQFKVSDDPHGLHQLMLFATTSELIPCLRISLK